MQSERADLDLVTKVPYLRVLTYPKVSNELAKVRVAELRELRVEEVVFEGHTRIGSLGVLGLGTVGVVVKVRVGEAYFALKIRRADANRQDLEDEARVTSLVNRVGVGPEVYGHTRDAILMKLLESQEIGDWLKGVRGAGSREKARELVHALLNQCRKLDIMGVDHGQLSNLRKHAVVAEGRPWILDFESAGTSRKPRNVTTAAQYLFVGGALAPAMRRALGVRDTATLKALLGEYKRDQSDYRYSKVLEHLRLA
ncbi:MAG: serine/threonine protein kinase [Nitrososphaerota archaeon]|nr:serine/threonine protein kinase [Nitrososphaerota archaeon]